MFLDDTVLALVLGLPCAFSHPKISAVLRHLAAICSLPAHISFRGAFQRENYGASATSSLAATLDLLEAGTLGIDSVSRTQTHSG